ncbi:MAG: hypothetical protein JNL38_24130 [Myxococcales bacterium]|nr:hypothetical protein [Myxococcales bacterium]
MTNERAAAWVVVGLLATSAVGCDDERDRRRPTGSPRDFPSALARAASARPDAGEPGRPADPIDPPPQSGDLKAEVERFTTVDACVAEHARIDPLVGDALRAVGYGTFVRDTCRILEALKAKDRGKCDAITASSLKSHCVSTVAMAAGAPDACPWEIPQEPESGRAPRCLAVAARDPRLCAAESTLTGRAACEAVATRDKTKCTLAGEEKEECTRQVERLRGFIDPSEVKLPTLIPPDAKLVLKTDGGVGGPRDLTTEVRRGVVLVVERGDRVTMVLGRVELRGGSSLVPGPGHSVRVGAKLVVGEKAEVERFEIELPLRPALVVPGSRSDLKASVTAKETKRGAPIAFSIEGTVDDVELKVTGSTFVRDVVSASR